MKRFCLKLLSSSSWGCELKKVDVSTAVRAVGHPPREDVSWKMKGAWGAKQTGQSSSSWGCELKITHTGIPWTPTNRHPLHEDVSWKVKRGSFITSELSHPLHEDVSWKVLDLSATSLNPRHPLHEDVSWKSSLLCSTLIHLVILFMRMWVEKSLFLHRPFLVLSSSSWGCELKNNNKHNFKSWRCHPLHEDVSWKIYRNELPGLRVWSSSSWGCELKSHDILSALLPPQSSSSWGCELKSYFLGFYRCVHRHPLHEDVRWKATDCIAPCIAFQSSSSWGCELKRMVFWRLITAILVILLVRMWVEKPATTQEYKPTTVILLVRMWVEKYRRKSDFFHSGRHPPCEDVSWNNDKKQSVGILKGSSSSRECELKCHSLNDIVYDQESSSSRGCELKCYL